MKPRNALTDLPYRLIVQAARKAPPALAERLAEEWLADLESRSGAAARLRLAMGCYWATVVITRDCRVPQLAASGAAAAAKPFWGDRSYGLPQFSRRSLAFITILGIHALLIYGFATGLAQQVVTSLPQLTHAVFIETTSPRPPPTPLPTDFRPTLIHSGVPDPLDPTGVDLTTETDPTGDSPPLIATVPGDPPVPPAVKRALGGPGAGFPNTDDFYPPVSRRMAETGTAIVQVCVDAQGRLTADPALARSSGSRRIDAGALNLAKAGSGHYRPTTEDGRPVNSCYSYRIRFALDD